MFTSTLLNIQTHVSLKPYHTFSIDVSADFFVSISSIEELRSVLSDSQFISLPKLILGGGSNIVFTKNFPGLVIKNNIKRIEINHLNEQYVELAIGAGESWHETVLFCVENGWAGIENLVLIPGTVGAAPIQNIGAYGVELCNVLESVQALHIATQEIHTFTREECELGYRDSIFKNKFRDQYVITHVILRLKKNPALRDFHLNYGDLNEMLKNTQPTLKTISDAVMHIRRSKLPDPQYIPNAGSFFKNPIISADKLQQLRLQYPAIPHYTFENNFKIAAAWLIENARWKGKHIGHVGVHDKQALVLINLGLATGNEVKTLAEKIQASVIEKFDIKLITEVNIL